MYCRYITAIYDLYSPIFLLLFYGALMAKANIINTLLATSRAANDLASMLPETDFVTELKDVLLYHDTLLNVVVSDSKVIDVKHLKCYYDKSKEMSLSVEKLKGIKK